MPETGMNSYVKLATKYTEEYAPGKNYALIVDYSLPADKPRLFLVNVKRQTVEYYWYTSHGVGSGDYNRATKFSNTVMSKKSSLGLMLTDTTYTGKHGRSLRLKGQEPGKNSNVYVRTIVLHPATYVNKSYMKYNTYPGMSWGCITLDPAMSDYIIDRLGQGSVVYAIGP